MNDHGMTKPLSQFNADQLEAEDRRWERRADWCAGLISGICGTLALLGFAALFVR